VRVPLHRMQALLAFGRIVICCTPGPGAVEVAFGVKSGCSLEASMNVGLAKVSLGSGGMRTK
jgi:hypothetical protein